MPALHLLFTTATAYLVLLHSGTCSGPCPNSPIPAAMARPSVTLSLLVCVASLLLAFSSTRHIPVQPDDLSSKGRVLQLFESWIAKHSKNYTAPDGSSQKHSRFQVFKENLRYIHSHNQKKGVTHRLGLTPFADLTNEEFRAWHLGFRLPANPRPLELCEAQLNKTVHVWNGNNQRRLTCASKFLPLWTGIVSLGSWASIPPPMLVLLLGIGDLSLETPGPTSYAMDVTADTSEADAPVEAEAHAAEDPTEKEAPSTSQIVLVDPERSKAGSLGLMAAVLGSLVDCMAVMETKKVAERSFGDYEVLKVNRDMKERETLFC